MMRSRERERDHDTWITNAILFTQNDRRQALRKNLRIVDGRIAAITSASPPRAAKRGGKSGAKTGTHVPGTHVPGTHVPGTHVIDAQGLTILPGFVQAHVHLCQTLFRNQADDLELMDWLTQRIWVMEAAHTEETLHTSALVGIYELLSSGTTCLLDMGTVRHTQAIFEAARETGIRACIGKCLMDHPTTTPEGLREPTRDALAEARALYNAWHGRENDRLRVSYAPRFVISCTEGLLNEVSRLARDQKALIHTHASENLKEIQLVKQLVGCENIEYLDQLGLTSPGLVLAHCVWLKPNEKEILKRTGTHVVHCPSSNLKLASGLAHVPDLRARGINVALGADGAPCNNNLNMFTEMRLAALIHKPGAGPKAMRAHEVLDMATRSGAQALGWADDIGSIEIGKKADLIALDLRTPLNTVWSQDVLNPEAIASSVVYSSSPQQLRWTMVDGRVLFREGQCTTLPSSGLASKLARAQDIIRRRAPVPSQGVQKTRYV